jgi:hypothetical protein
MRNHYGIREKRWRQHISGCVSYQLIHIEKSRRCIFFWVDFDKRLTLQEFRSVYASQVLRNLNFDLCRNSTSHHPFGDFAIYMCVPSDHH